jgi:hypothetical protein
MTLRPLSEIKADDDARRLAVCDKMIAACVEIKAATVDLLAVRAQREALDAEWLALRRRVTDLERRLRRRPPLWEKARVALSVSDGEPMTVRAILAVLLAAGVVIGGRHPRETLRQTMLRKPAIFARHAGRFALCRPESGGAAS